MRIWPFRKRSQVSVQEGVEFENADTRAVIFGGYQTQADINITPDVARTCVPVWSAVNFLSTSIANLPLHVYRRDSDGGKERLTGNVADVLGRFWNDELTAYEGLRWMVQQSCYHGVSYAYIDRRANGAIMNLIPLETKHVDVDRIDGNKLYTYDPTARDGPVGRRFYSARDIIELPFFEGDDLLKTHSPVLQCKEAIALCLALEKYNAQFVKGGGLPPLLMKFNQKISDEAAKRLRKQMNAYLAKIKRDNSQFGGLPLELDPVDPKMITPQAGQMIEARRFANEEISRVFGVPPILNYDLSKGTYNNSEQQDSQFTKHTLSKWVRQIESQINLKFFGRNSSMFAEFDLRAVERGLFRERIEGLARQIQTGMITPNEARAAENMPPVDDENADKLFIQGATLPIDMVDQNAGNGDPGGSPASGEGDGEPASV